MYLPIYSHQCMVLQPQTVLLKFHIKLIWAALKLFQHGINSERCAEATEPKQMLYVYGLAHSVPPKRKFPKSNLRLRSKNVVDVNVFNFHEASTLMVTVWMLV